MTLRSNRALAFAALISAGCASAAPAPTPPPAPIVAPSLLAAVPADATWLVALPDVSRAGFDAATRHATGAALAVRPLLTELVGELVTDGALPEAAATLEGVRRALPVVVELLDPERLEALGVRFPMGVVVHGAPIWPVARVALADPARTRAELERRLATAPGVSREVAPGGVVWVLSVDTWTVKVGVVGAQLVAAAWSSELGGEVPSEAFAAPTVDRAGAPGAASAALREVLAQTGGRPDLALAWVDMAALSGRFLDGLLGALEPEGEAEARELAACRSELGRLVAGLPRLALGYRAWTPEASSLVLSADLADPELAASIARLGQGGAALAVEPWEAPEMAMSLSLDVGELGDLLGLLARRMAAAGYTCPEVRELGDDLANAAMQVGVSGRLLLGGLHALHVRVAAWNPDAPTPLALLTAQVVAVAVHDHPDQLMALLQRFGGVEVELPPDGQTVAVAQTPKVVVGRAGPLLGVALGGAAEAPLGRALAGGLGGPAPLLSYAVDGREGDSDPGLVALIDETIAAAPSFPDRARIEGDMATVGATPIAAAAVYAHAATLEFELDAVDGETPRALLEAAFDALVERELVRLALRAAREPTLREAAPGDPASLLVKRRLERLGKLRVSAREVRERYAKARAQWQADGYETPTIDEVTPLLEGLIASEAVTAERARLVALQRKRTKVLDRHAEALSRVASHWEGVRALRDAVAERLRSTGPAERLSGEVRVRDGRVELLGTTGPATRASGEPAAPAAD